MAAGAAVGACARSQLDFPLREVLFELRPFLRGRVAVFAAGSQRSTASDERAMGFVLGRQRADDREASQPCLLCDFSQHRRREVFVGVHSSGWDLLSGFGNLDVFEDQEVRAVVSDG